MDSKSAALLAAGIIAAALITSVVPNALSSAARNAEQPIATGEIKYVVTYKYPAEHSSNESMEHSAGKVQVYDRFIVIEHPKGECSLHLHGWYTHLKFVPDR